MKTTYKIPRALPQWQGETCILVATGRQDAVFYEAHDGVIERLDAFKIPRPHYSDNEGVFMTKGQGGVMRSGSVKEIHHRDIVRDFIREFRKRAKRLPHDAARLYIFSPREVKDKVSDALPSDLKRKVEAVVPGNYYAEEPLSLVDRAARLRHKDFSPQSEEEGRIMRVPVQR